MITGYRSLVPAYGRDYTNGEQATKDFRDGKDFILMPEGCYCSITDFAEGATANIRYSRLTKVIPVHVPRSTDGH